MRRRAVLHGMVALPLVGRTSDEGDIVQVDIIDDEPHSYGAFQY